MSMLGRVLSDLYCNDGKPTMVTLSIIRNTYGENSGAWAILRFLEEKGFVRRELDGGKIRVYLTPHGKMALSRDLRDLDEELRKRVREARRCMRRKKRYLI
ncbi:hypothetical protein [Candidatus Methanodesulfokora washburnensis]|uniref:ArnR1-like winged helix-turn-helix domain-containing protein n=1 Tax=Candidatus Methanodesulfokora washburnensis TaxID=2478471 RepID=A0A3R9PX72_9CREN|nr:hypothetical protein [Candidatus Methanodesulfokores washburnensis]RSN75425.1 hypothetical protein D6D85_06165 [Candidatus Methanodesulfokores washburnensis]